MVGPARKDFIKSNRQAGIGGSRQGSAVAVEVRNNVAIAKQPAPLANKDDKTDNAVNPAKQPSSSQTGVAPTSKQVTAGGGASPAPAPRRGPNVKEVIPFAWKLLGVARGAILTLFKSVEREETEAQMERVLRDGYYTNLRIVENDYKIKQNSAVKSELQKVKAEQGKKAVKWGSASKASKKSKEKPKPVKAAKKATPVKKTKTPKKVVKAKKVTKAKKKPAKKVSKTTTAKKKVSKSKKSAKPKAATASKKPRKKAVAKKPHKKKTSSSRKK